jgi:methylated-DNA-[protein]-cysteine S-methyltransferase
MMPTCTIDSPVGLLGLEADDDGLTAVTFHPLADAPSPPTHPVLQQAADELAEYFAGRRTTFTVPLAWSRGTEFQRAVWRELTQIPYGQTWSYADVARRIGRPAAVRAVGAANGANPHAIIVPCHRVIGSDGSLTGYGGGMERKTWLLQNEGQALPRKAQGSLPFAE